MRRVFVLVGLLVLLAAAADAQIVQRPARPHRGLFGGGPPPDPNRNRQELTLTASMLGGYDDYLAPEARGGSGLLGPTPILRDTYSGYLDGALSYFVGKPMRSFSATANAFTSTYSGVGIDPLLGGALRLTGQTSIGRRSSVEVSQDAEYTPSLVLGAYEGLAADVDRELLPEAGLGTGFLNQRSFTSTTSVLLDRRWTPRQWTAVFGSYTIRDFLGELGHDTTTHSGGVRYGWNPRRTLTLAASYYATNSESEQSAEEAIPLRQQSVELSGTYVRRLSATRQLSIGGGAGATHVNTLNVGDRREETYWTPSANATVSIGLGRTWLIGADYRRSLNVLPGVTLQPFATDAASLRTSGTLGRRVEAVLSVAFSNGRAPTGDHFGRFESYSGSAQLRYAVARCCALTTTYDYYYYRLRDVSQLRAGVPPEYDHNAVRVGFSFWWPLYGTSAAGSERAR